MVVKKFIKKLVYQSELLRNLYFLLRYRRLSRVARWMDNSLKTIEREKLTSVIFEDGESYVRTEFGCDFNFDLKKLGGLLGVLNSACFSKVC